LGTKYVRGRWTRFPATPFSPTAPTPSSTTSVSGVRPRRAATKGARDNSGPKENDLVKGAELRGLEPLTPTLPERLEGVRGGTPKFICAAQKAASSSADPCIRR
jgi:hypothetical protein